MSDVEEGSAKRAWVFYLNDMIEFSERVLSYTQGRVRSDFESRGLTYDATVRNLELIGEAATHIPVWIKDQTPGIPWRQIIATRNRLIHGYLGIDNDTLWSIIQEDIPALLPRLRAMKVEFSK